MPLGGEARVQRRVLPAPRAAPRSTAVSASFSRFSAAPRSRRCSGGALPSSFSSAVSVPLLAQHGDAHRVPGAQVGGRGQRGLGLGLQGGKIVGHGVSQTISRMNEQGRPAQAALCPCLRVPGGSRDPSRAACTFLTISAKARGVVVGDGGQHLAVHLDAGLLQPGDEARVGQAVLAHRGVDALDPQAAELALLVAPVAVGVLQRLLQPLQRDPVIGGRAADEALRLLRTFLWRAWVVAPRLTRAMAVFLTAARRAPTASRSSRPAWVSIWLPRLLRFVFWVRADRPWRFLPGPASTLPVAVILNRFLTDDFVFILGISISLSCRPCARSGMSTDAGVAAGHAHSRPGRANRGGCIAAG